MPYAAKKPIAKSVSCSTVFAHPHNLRKRYSEFIRYLRAHAVMIKLLDPSLYFSHITWWLRDFFLIIPLNGNACRQKYTAIAEEPEGRLHRCT
jgi:hypothetical protein